MIIIYSDSSEPRAITIADSMAATVRQIRRENAISTFIRPGSTQRSLPNIASFTGARRI